MNTLLKNVFSKTDQGPYLEINEDTVAVDLRNDLFLIIDGFGGSQIGDHCAELIKNSIQNVYTKIGGDSDATLPFYFSSRYLIEGNALINAMQFAHEEVKKFNKDKEMSKKGGASGIACALSENILTMVSTGNCQGLHYRKGNLNIFMEADDMSYLSEDSYSSNLLTAPMSGFGLYQELHLNVKELRIVEGDLLILLTDGAYSRIKKNELKYILEKSDAPFSEKVDEIFELVNSRGNLDNQSAIVLQF